MIIKRLSLLIALFCFIPTSFAQIIATEDNINERREQIKAEVQQDVKEHLDGIQNLSIIPVPICEMGLDKKGNTQLLLDTLSGYAVLFSNEKPVEYAYKYYSRGSYSLKKVNKDSAIYVTGNDLRFIDKYALSHHPSPFWIFASFQNSQKITFQRIFMGFGFYDNHKLELMGFSDSKPMLFNNPKDLLIHCFGSEKEYKRKKKIYEKYHPQTIATEDNLNERREQIIKEIWNDLGDYLKDIPDLSIIPIPECEMVLDKKGEVQFLLDTLSGLAVLFSGEKVIDYISGYDDMLPYYLVNKNKRPGIRIGKSNLLLIDSHALPHNPKPFWIYASSFRLFVGFGFYTNHKLELMGYFPSEPKIFDTPMKLLIHRFGSVKEYRKTKKMFENPKKHKTKP